MEDSAATATATANASAITNDLQLPSPAPRHTSFRVSRLEEELRPVNPVDIRIRDLYVRVPAPQSLGTTFASLVGRKPPPVADEQFYKTILDNVSAHCPAGSLTAILGGSGSGKTTLLNTISHRVTSKKLRINGAVTYNGNTLLRSVRSSYVVQEDILTPTLTVRETLQYAADLRLPDSTDVERRDAVESVILELGLSACADTRIGNSSHKGCSGGEKRRTSIGVQMLSNPSVLFCDEPTTGT